MIQGPNPYGKKLKSAKQQGRATAAKFGGGALVYKIINSRRKYAGKPGLRGAAMLEAARKLFAARLRSVGTLKAGWWGALKALGRAVGQPNELKEHQMSRIRAPSTATIAKPGFNPSVSVEYNLQAKDEHYQRGIEKRAVETFSGSWFSEMRSTIKYLEDKLSGALKKADASVPKKMSQSEATAVINRMLRR
jgi:hypothetical protein